MELATLKENIDQDLFTAKISGRIALSKMRLIDQASCKTAAYLDPRYAPFYYYLGKYIHPKSLVEFGFTLGLLSSTLIRSCKSVERFLGFKEQTKEYTSQRIGRSNIRVSFKGETEYFLGFLHEDDFLAKISPNSWDLFILNEETVYDKHLEYLDFLWSYLKEDGLVVAEYITRHKPAGEAFYAFCESKNRRPIVFDTRYGTGILQK